MRILALLALCIVGNSIGYAASVNRSINWPGTTLSGNPCFGKDSSYGPYDYISEKSRLKVVENFHFTPNVEHLVRGKSGSIDGDLDYTLRAFPNHHRALWSVSRHYLNKLRSPEAEKLQRFERSGVGAPPPECYFQRAHAFHPNDSTVNAIFGIYLHKRDRHEAALSAYRKAEAVNPNQAELVYNMGLLFADMGDWENAAAYARRATSLGYPLKGLQNRVAEQANRVSPSNASTD